MDVLNQIIALVVPYLQVSFFFLLALVSLRIGFVRRLLHWIATLPAAFVIAVTWLWSFLFWKPSLRISNRFGDLMKLSGLADWLIGERFQKSADPLLRGDREEAAKQWWPSTTFSFLYMKSLPADVVRPLYEDGRLIGGYELAWLSDRHFSRDALRNALQAGLLVAVLAASLPFFAAILGYVLPLLLSATKTLNIPDVRLEAWPDDVGIIAAPTSWWIGEMLTHTVSNIKIFARDSAIFLLALASFSAGCFLLMAFIFLREWQRQKARPYEVMTKDARVRWPFRAETRKLYNAAYNRQCAQATGYLKDAPLFHLGKATGLLRTRGDLTAASEGQDVVLDSEALFQHLLVLGGTGEGKTTALLKPLMRQFMSLKHVGMYVCDAKGVLWRDAFDIARQTGREKDVVIIGTGEGQFGVDALAFLSPTQVSSVFRSILKQIGQGARDSFWPDMATNVLRNVLTLAECYVETAQGKREAKNGVQPYSLWWVYQTLLDEKRLFDVLGVVKEEGVKLRNLLADSKTDKEEEERYAACMAFNSEERSASVDYLDTAWRNMAPATKSGIIATLSQILDGFGGSKPLRERFACGSRKEIIDLKTALDGKLVLVALSNIEDGLTARLVSILLKTALYRLARVREAKFKAMTPPKNPQDKPCIIIMDEVQEIVTTDPASGLSDATFWNVARSTGVAGIFASQTLAALKQALGAEASANFIQQARSKIFFRSEDKETVDYAIWCAGQSERGRVYDEGQRESIEFRHLIDGWEPFMPIDPNDTMKFNRAVLFSVAQSLLFPESVSIGRGKSDTSFYKPDMRFIPDHIFSYRSGDSTGLYQSSYHARMSALQASYWRAEDKEREMRSRGNETRPLLDARDLFNMGRWHAFAHIQRAGLVRQDIIAVQHDFS